MQQAATHQRSLAHWESARINADVHVWSSSRRPLLHGAMHSCTRFRGVPTTLHGKNSWPSSSCDMSGQVGLAHTLTVPLVPNDQSKKKVNVTPHSQAHSLFQNEILPDGSVGYEKILLLILKENPRYFLSTNYLKYSTKPGTVKKKSVTFCTIYTYIYIYIYIYL